MPVPPSSPAAPPPTDPPLSAEARRRHWEGVYATRDAREVSWYQQVPEVSLRLIAHAGAAAAEDGAGVGAAAGAATGAAARLRIVDVGAGASTLVDELLARGDADVTVVDISQAALDTVRGRLGAAAGRVRFLVADVTDWTPPGPVDVWHDRAVFHFLTEAEDRARYMAALRAAVVPGGTVIIAAFAEDGPERCSGLPVRRTSAAMLADELGPDFICEETATEAHRTPGGAIQSFLYARFTRRAASRAA